MLADPIALVNAFHLSAERKGMACRRRSEGGGRRKRTGELRSGEDLEHGGRSEGEGRRKREQRRTEDLKEWRRARGKERRRGRRKERKEGLKN